MQLNRYGGMLRVAMVLSGIYLVLDLVEALANSHPLLATVGVVFNAMFLPAFVLHFRMREGWFLPGVFSAMSAVYAVKELLKTGAGTRWTLWIDIPLCIICAVVAEEEGIRALRRHQREGQEQSKTPVS